MKRNSQICLHLLVLFLVTIWCSCKKTPEKILYRKDGLWEMTFNISYKVINGYWNDTIFRLDTTFVHQSYFDKNGFGYYTENGNRHSFSWYNKFESLSIIYADDAFIYFPKIPVTISECKKDFELWKCNGSDDPPYTNNIYYLNARIELHRK